MTKEYFCKEVQIDQWNELQSFVLLTYKKNIGSLSDAMPLLINQDVISKIEQLLKKDTHKMFNDDVKISHSILFFSKPNWQQPIHIDDQTESGMYTSLNLPIKNCSDSTMNWYSGEYEQSAITLNSGITYKKLTMDKEIIVCSETIDRPYVVRTNIPHSVINYSKYYRIMLAIRYVQNIPLLDI